MTLNGALQMAGSIPLVGSLLKEELPAFARDSKQEGTRRRVQHPLLYLPEFDLQHFVQFLTFQGMEDHDFVQAIHELWRELPPRRFHRGPLHFLVQSGCLLVLRLDETHTPCIRSAIWLPPRFEVRKITVCDKSTFRLSPSVSVALSSIPNSSCHKESLAFSISSNNRKLSFM